MTVDNDERTELLDRIGDNHRVMTNGKNFRIQYRVWKYWWVFFISSHTYYKLRINSPIEFDTELEALHTLFSWVEQDRDEKTKWHAIEK